MYKVCLRPSCSFRFYVHILIHIKNKRPSDSTKLMIFTFCSNDEKNKKISGTIVAGGTISANSHPLWHSEEQRIWVMVLKDIGDEVVSL